MGVLDLREHALRNTGTFGQLGDAEADLLAPATDVMSDHPLELAARLLGDELHRR